MKKRNSIILVLILVLLLSGCGNKNTNTVSTPSTNNTPTVTAVTAPAQDDTISNKVDILLANSGDIKVYIDTVTKDNNEYELLLRIENKTKDDYLYCYDEDFYIDDYGIRPTFGGQHDAKSGKTGFLELYFKKGEIEKIGLNYEKIRIIEGMLVYRINDDFSNTVEIPIMIDLKDCGF